MDAQKTFILLTLVSPAQEIIERLESRFYSEKDIPWLNEKLRQMASVASRMMRKGKHMAASPVPEGAPLNEYHTEKYLGYFRTLERFFRYHMEEN
jgi:hypothetical protein